MPVFDFIENTEQREKAENLHKIEVDQLTVDLTNANKVTTEEAVAGLKTKNAEILDEKKTLSDNLKKFEGYDPEAVKVATDFYTKNSVNLTAAQKSSNEYQGLFESKVIDDGVRAAAVKAGMIDTAVEDAVLRGRGVFSLDTNKMIEARDAEGKLAISSDKKVLTTENWVEDLKETSPHYWPPSQGAGATGGKIGPESDKATKLQALADAGDVTAYRAMRDKK